MNDTFHAESKLPLSRAARAVFETEGVRSPSRATLCRWIRKGKLGVKLESKRFNGNYLTSIEAIKRFIAEIDRITEPRDVRQQRRAKELSNISSTLDQLGL